MSTGVGYYWFTLVSYLLSDNKSSDQRTERQLPIIRGIKVEPKQQSAGEAPASVNNIALDNPTSAIIKRAQSSLQLLLKKYTSVVTSNSQLLSKYSSNIKKECLPGRDDKKGEINPTTKRNRECLRFVQKNSKPRIGIMVSPGFISNGVGHWIKNSLDAISQKCGNEIEALITPHVPVYGYGKSHGFSKLIRVTLPLPLAIIDSYLFEKLRKSSEDGLVEELDVSMLQKGGLTPTKSEIETILKLIMRWNCRISHVSAHTSMIGVSLDAVLEDPNAKLEQILEFVFANNWEWEGGKGNNVWKDINPNQEASDVIDSKSAESPDYLTLIAGEITLIQEHIDKLYADEKNVQTIIQSAFEEEMKLSEDMTHWPCPSFWVGVEKLKMNSGLVPDCRDGHPWIKCTINRDKCEVKQDAKCN